jgi:hypothetical protein
MKNSKSKSVLVNPTLVVSVLLFLLINHLAGFNTAVLSGTVISLMGFFTMACVFGFLRLEKRREAALLVMGTFALLTFICLAIGSLFGCF